MSWDGVSIEQQPAKGASDAAKTVLAFLGL